MGCLTLNISQIGVPDACKVAAEGSNTGVECSALKQGDCIQADIDSANKNLDVDSRVRTYVFSIGKQGKNIQVGITAALVCRVSLDKWEYFYVTEGPLIVEEGYFRVRKS